MKLNNKFCWWHHQFSLENYLHYQNASDFKTIRRFLLKDNFSKSQDLHAGSYKKELIKQDKWYGHISIKILGVHFGSSVLDNSNWDKISHCKFSWKRIVNQILLSKLWYIGQIYTILKFIIKELGKTIAQLPIW